MPMNARNRAWNQRGREGRRFRQSLLPAQLTGPVIVPFNVQKQTALLSVMARLFPRLAFGVGPQQLRIVAVKDEIASQTATITIVTTSTGDPQAFAEVC